MYDRGSARELIAEGISGYVVSPDNVTEMASAVGRTETIDRSACADYARERFSLRKLLKTISILCSAYASFLH